jgi:nicotinic acid mononucleotide adenylyltransferase
VVVPRSGNAFDPTAPAAQKVLAELALGPFSRPGEEGRVVLTEAASLPISGSDLRRRARTGRSLAYRMPAAVAAYVREHGLYRDAE